MQQSNAVKISAPKPRKNVVSMPLDSTYGADPSVWMYPGKVIPIAPFIEMGMAYTTLEGKKVPYFKFWYMGERVKPYFFDQNNQINLSTSCRRLITRLASKPMAGPLSQEKILIAIEAVPYF